MKFADTMPPPNSLYGYKYLGSMIDSKLTRTPDMLAKYTKPQRRKLRHCNTDKSLFYKTSAQSVVTFAIRRWAGAEGRSLSVQNLNMLDRVMQMGRKIIGSAVKSITSSAVMSG